MKDKGRPHNLPESVGADTKKDGETYGDAALRDAVHGKELERYKESIRLAPDIRNDYVEMIRRKIKKGTYDVKAEDIAEKIIRTGNLL